MNNLNILVVGGGIGGLTTAIALRRKNFTVEVIEKDPDWSVYGVGIIQQSNVIRAVSELGILDDYLDAGFGCDFTEIYTPDGTLAAKIPAPKLAEGYPAIVGVGRPALHKVLGENAKAAGATIRLGVTIKTLKDSENQVTVEFSNGETGSYDLVVGADGLYSDTRHRILPEAKEPEFTGQSVWRYNFPRPPELDCIQIFEGAVGTGLVPLSNDKIYMYITTAEPGNPRYPREGLAAAMRAKLTQACPRIQAMAEEITDDNEVVYKPLEWHMLYGDWHKGRVVLVGDAVHGTTPHLGQGAGMAIEDGLVLAEELEQATTPEEAFQAYRNRRFERCKYIVESSVAICFGQLGKGPLVNNAEATQAMFNVVAQPI